MIVQDELIKVDKSAGIQESQFKIKATGKAFRILSDGLYSDKILAVIRELCCNAYDAHVAKGNPEQPFEVTLPTTLDPHFSVKDFGIGLSHEDVIHLYTTYFESTKTGSNDFIGALGLGSKSPFSYVDKFSVISIFNGVKSFYTAFIGPDGSPSIARMGDGTPTDEQNGVEVTFPVKMPDVSTFATKAARALHYFTVKPIIKNNSQFRFLLTTYSREEPTWKLCSALTFGTSMAIQGNVGYPLNSDSIKSFLSPEEKMVAFLPLELYFQIGELEPVASREGLSYEENTVNNIKKKLKEIYDILIGECDDFFAGCKTEFDARLRFYKIFGTHIVGSGMSHSNIRNITEFYRQCINAGVLKLVWNNMHITSNMIVIDPKKYPNLQIDFEYMGRKFNPVDIKANNFYSRSSYGLSINAGTMKSVYFDDLLRGGTTRLRGLLDKQRYAIYARPLQANSNKVSEDEMKKAVVEFEQLKRVLDGVPTEVTSSIPVIKKTELLLSSVKELLRWNGFYAGNRNYGPNCWARVPAKSISEDDTKYYVPVYDSAIVSDLGFTGATNIGGRIVNNFDHFLNALNKSDNLFDFEKVKLVYGLRKKDITIIKDDPTWVNLFDYMVDFVKDKKAAAHIQAKLSYYDNFNFLNMQKKISILFSNDLFVQKMPDGEFKEFVTHLVAIAKEAKTTKIDSLLLTGFRQISNICKIKPDSKNLTLSDQYRNVLVKYPMIHYLEYPPFTKLEDKDVLRIESYVASVEANNNNNNKKD